MVNTDRTRINYFLLVCLLCVFCYIMLLGRQRAPSLGVSLFPALGDAKRLDQSVQLPPEFLKNVGNKRSNYLSSDVITFRNSSNILILITTARKNEQVRSWYRTVYDQLVGVEYRFIIGHRPTGEDFQLTKKVQNEVEKFSDFIIGDFPDRYENLIYKTHAAYQYAEGILRFFSFYS